MGTSNRARNTGRNHFTKPAAVRVADNSAPVAVSENALTQDGPAAGPDAQSRSRLIQIQHNTGADTVTGAAVAPASARAMSKKLLFDFTANGVDPQCVEGMTWGPTLKGGARSLVLVSDNNFGLAGKTAFHLLAVDGGGISTGS